MSDCGPSYATTPATWDMQIKDFTTSTMQRVKVYRLNAEGTWDDQGTGNVCVELLEQSDSIGLVVISEEDDRKTLLIHRICHAEYQRQGEGTIISWSDAEIGTDIALSFAEGVGCNEIWEKITAVQQKFDKRHQENPGRRRIIDEFEQAGLTDGDFHESSSMGPVELPPASMENLPELAKVLADLGGLFQRERAAQQMMAPGYVRKLLDLFRTCEDLENAEALTHLYVIMKSAVMLNDSNLLEHLLSEENVMDVVGALEYEPDVPEHMRVHHREFLRDKAVFKEIVPIEDVALRAKIHQTYRMGYVKDVILPRVLDDGTMTTLNTLMHFNNVDVLIHLQRNGQFLPQLFQRLRTTQPGDEGWRDAVAFLQEMCGLAAKNLQAETRIDLFSKLVSLGLFEVLTEVMQCGDPGLRQRATDVLYSVVQHDSSPLREFMLGQTPRPVLLSLMLQPYVEGGDSGIMEQILDILKGLINPENLREAVESDKFLELFYNDYLPELLGKLENCTKKNEHGKLPDATALGHIVELLIYCVGHHGYRIKYYVLRINMVAKILHLIHRREKWLVVAAVRFLRACVTPKDEFYHRYLIRNNLFDEVVSLLLKNGDRYNLLNSALLDLFEYIRRENLKLLVEHVVERHGDSLMSVDYVETFKNMRIKYDQMRDRESDRGGAAPGGQGFNNDMLVHRRRRDDRAMDKDEEDYFDKDDDDDSQRDTGAATAGPADAEALAAAAPQANGVLTAASPIHALPGLGALQEYGEDDDLDDDNDSATDQAKKRGTGSVLDPSPKRSRIQEQLVLQRT